MYLLLVDLPANVEPSSSTALGVCHGNKELFYKKKKKRQKVCFSRLGYNISLFSITIMKYMRLDPL